MKRDVQTLEKVGVTCFGNQWQVPLAQALEINDRTVRRWVSGDQPIGDWVWEKLPGICRARSLELLELSQKLP